MPLKPSERESELHQLLLQLVASLNEKWVEDVFFDPTDNAFARYHSTTWAELERNLWAARRAPYGRSGFYLTPRGWSVALRATESEQAPDWRKDRIVRLVTVLKDNHCDRRNIEHGRVPLEQLASEVGFSGGWIRNALESHMLDYVVRDKHMDAWYQDGDVVVGGGFAQPKLAR